MISKAVSGAWFLGCLLALWLSETDSTNTTSSNSTVSFSPSTTRISIISSNTSKPGPVTGTSSVALTTQTSQTRSFSGCQTSIGCSSRSMSSSSVRPSFSSSSAEATTNSSGHTPFPTVTSTLVTASISRSTTSVSSSTSLGLQPSSSHSSAPTTGIDTRKSSSSSSPSLPSSSSGATTKADSSGENKDEYKPVVIALAVIASIAAVVATLFILLYLRSSYLCYHRLHPNRSSEDAFTLNNMGNSPLSSPIRDRLTSLSSIRKQVTCKSEPFSIMAFRDHVRRLHADSDYLFSLEYEAVGTKKYLNETDKKIDLACHEGKKANNKNKNRYSDILPYDHSRIVLTEIDGDPDSSYINANYVDSYRKPKAYIAAQGPLPATLSDFWRMLWESKTRVVVMVTNLFERSRSKCVKYWPDDGTSIYGFMSVTKVKEESFSHYVVRTFSVEPSSHQDHYIKTNSESEARVIQQFQFTEWPDHDVPVHPVVLLRFIRHSKLANPVDAGPLVVHCSAGVGRSGAYMMIDSMIERIEDDKSVDVFNFLTHIRTQRMLLVQEESQYAFVHDSLMEYINFGDTNIPVIHFHTRLQSLRSVNSETHRTRLREEFEDIEHLKTHEKHKWAGKQKCNVSKNRRNDVLPVEKTRVKLPPILGIDGSDYINASFIDGFSRKRQFIATQAPMTKTAECFYRMIWATNCTTIVMLLDEEQWRTDDDFADLPTEDEAVTCGRFEIQLEAQDVSEQVTVRKLRLFSPDASDGRTVKHFHYRCWPTVGFPQDKMSLINFIEQVWNHKKSEGSETPIVVHCNDGVGPTAVFCLVSSLYDQIVREQNVDVFHAAKLFRAQRPKMIENEDQYMFCYDLIDEIILKELGDLTKDSGCVSDSLTSNSLPHGSPRLSASSASRPQVTSGPAPVGDESLESSDESKLDRREEGGLPSAGNGNLPTDKESTNSDTSSPDSAGTSPDITETEQPSTTSSTTMLLHENPSSSVGV